MTAEHRDIDVVVLCGGRGVRLRPLTDSLPKAMVPVRGRPMLDHIVEFYERQGFRRFTFCVGYLGERIRGHFSARPSHGASYRYSDAGEGAGMLQRLWMERDRISELALVTYGDTFIDLDVEGLLACHRGSGALATIVTAPIQNPFGIVDLDVEGLVERFREKPVFNYYIGCFVLEHGAFDYADPELVATPDGAGLVALFNRLAEARRLAAFSHSGLQISFNTEAEKKEAEAALAAFCTYAEHA